VHKKTTKKKYIFLFCFKKLKIPYYNYIMEVFVGEDGIRRRRTRDAKGKTRTYKLCSGKENTCESDAKAEGMCVGCKTGNYKGGNEEHVEGELFEENGFRYIFTGGQKRKYCTGKDNTCDKYVRADDLCLGCTNGREHVDNSNLKLGDIIEKDGSRFKFDGKQLRRLCSGEENKCPKFATKQGLCIIHSNGGVRKPKKQADA
jgi:hypothetical protein